MITNQKLTRPLHEKFEIYDKRAGRMVTLMVQREKDLCKGCYFDNRGEDTCHPPKEVGTCLRRCRTDKIDVIFKKIKQNEY